MYTWLIRDLGYRIERYIQPSKPHNKIMSQQKGENLETIRSQFGKKDKEFKVADYKKTLVLCPRNSPTYCLAAIQTIASSQSKRSKGNKKKRSM
jgi:hypothetical protein